MQNKERFLDANIPDDMAATIRPRTLSDFIGHESLKQNLSVFVSGARSRREAMDHVLLYGPPGLGKTTLAHIVANELGTNFRATAAPMLTKQGDLAAILTALEPMDVLFIDEIHRLPTAIEEVLYSAMEDFKLDIMLGEGPSAKSVRIDLPPFTLVGATTRSGLLSTPLRDRFGIPMRLEFYEPEELMKIVKRGAKIMQLEMTEDGAMEIAKRSRGTPRIAGRLLRRVRDFALNKAVTADIADMALTRLEVDNSGLDLMDRRYLTCIALKYGGGPVGAETLCAALSEERDTIEEIIEPYLMQLGLVMRTPRGRVLSQAGYRHLGMAAPKNMVQPDLLENLK